MTTIWIFDTMENEHNSYHREDCMKMFCCYLREHATNVINFDRKKMLPLTKKELEVHKDATTCYLCGESIPKKDY